MNLSVRNNRLGLYIITFGSSLISTDTLRVLGYFLMAVSIVLPFLTYKFKIARLSLLDVAFLLMTIAAFFSIIFHHDIIAPTYVLALFMAWLSIRLQTSVTRISLEDVYKIFFTGSMSLVFIGLLSVRFTISSYEGIFYNPNSLGNLLSLLLAMHYSKNPSLSIRFSKTFLLRTFLLVILLSTSSRISILSFTIIVFAISILRASNTAIFRIRRKNIVQVILSIPVIVLLFNPIWDIFKRSIIQKNKLKSTDLSNGRFDTWSSLLDGIHIFGNGRDYTDGVVLNSAQSAHNTFVGLFAQNGIIVACFYLFICILMLYIAARYSRSSRNTFRFLPLAIVMSFFYYVTY